MFRRCVSRGSTLRLWAAPDWPVDGAPDRGRAVELRRHLGGMTTYGLLGGVLADDWEFDLAPIPAGALDLARPSDERWVHLGLPDQYRGPVGAAVRANPALAPVRVVVAAHHVVDSSIVAFYDTAKVLSALLKLGDDVQQLSEEELGKRVGDAVRADPYPTRSGPKLGPTEDAS